MAKPTRELVERAKEAIRTSADAAYFFDHLTSPDWIRPLYAAGMFGTPPPPTRDGDYIQLASWPQSRYLARMAALAPQDVAELIPSLSDTDNGRVLVDFADALLAMPVATAAGLTELAVAWLDRPYLLLLPDRLAKLVTRFSVQGEGDAALKLAGSLLRLEPGRVREREGVDIDLPPEPRPRIDTYEYQRIVGEILKPLANAAGLQAFDLVIDLLEQAVQLSKFDESDDRSDYSYIWRHTVEASDQNRLHDIKDSLVDAVRDCGVQLAGSDRALVDPMFQKLVLRSAIFRRIALHLVRVAAPTGSGLVPNLLLNPDLLYGIECYHEYWLLLQGKFGELSDEDRLALLGLIAVGPSFYRDHPELSDADRRQRIEVWQLRILAAIQDQLPTEWSSKQRELVRQYGEPDHPDLLSYSSGGWTGPTSPLTAQQLEEMSTADIVSYLRAWEATDDWQSPTPEGLSRELSGAARAQPLKFSAGAAQFRDVEPTYVRGLFWGLREAVANKVVVDWEPVLDLAAWALGQPRNLPNRDDRFGDIDPGWSWTRKAIADLISVGMNAGPSELPFDLRPKVWSLLEQLVEDEDPTPEHEEHYGGSNMDPLTLAINTVRGQAIEAVIQHALWIRRHIVSEDADYPTSKSGFEAMPEIRGVLEDHLDTSHDPSRAVRAVYGRWFPWLLLVDERWSIDNRSSIYPPGEPELSYWEAAWDAYIAFNQPYDRPFDVLRGEYRRAIERLPASSSDLRRPAEAISRLAQHLVIMYWRGRLDLAAGDLLAQFYNKADDDLRGWAMSTIGRGLQDLEDGTSKPKSVELAVLQRLMDLWSWRLAAVRSADDRSQYAKELSEFGWWFTSRVFDETWALSQLTTVLRITGRVEATHLVLRTLGVMANSHAGPVIEVLRLMVRGDTEGWTVLTWTAEITTVLEAVLSGTDAHAQSVAVEVIHQLGARGQRQYRDLLP